MRPNQEPELNDRDFPLIIESHKAQSMGGKPPQQM
jgi:hypothetical protein